MGNTSVTPPVESFTSFSSSFNFPTIFSSGSTVQPNMCSGYANQNQSMNVASVEDTQSCPTDGTTVFSSSCGATTSSFLDFQTAVDCSSFDNSISSHYTGLSPSDSIIGSGDDAASGSPLFSSSSFSVSSNDGVDDGDSSKEIRTSIPKSKNRKTNKKNNGGSERNINVNKIIPKNVSFDKSHSINSFEVHDLKEKFVDTQDTIITNAEKKEKAVNAKNIANECFRKGYIEMAIMHYTDAIHLDPSQPIFWTNRALCFKKLQQWNKVLNDCRYALKCDEKSVKAHYLLGLGLVNTDQPDQGLLNLSKAKSLCGSRKDCFENDIEFAILNAKKVLWEKKRDEKNIRYKELESFFCKAGKYLEKKGKISEDEFQNKLMNLREIIEDASESLKIFEVPDFLYCKISMNILKDPVCTTSGQTYERELLEQHIKHNGPFDPISRKHCSLQNIFPNYAIRNAVKYFIDKYPWMYSEY